MQYKKLDTEDFIVGYNPIIEPAGADDGGLLVTGEYDITSGSLAGDADGTQRVYRQFANIIQGDSTSNLPIGSSFYALTIRRANFKESIHPSSFSINGVRLLTGSADVNYCEAGREYVSTDSTFYLYPDIGVVLKTANTWTNTKAASEEIDTIGYAFIRAGAAEFNYSTNPSFLDENDYVRFTEFAYDPKVYPTTIGLYNDNGDCLAVAKLPKPTKKDFNTDLLFKVELKF